MSGRHWYCRPCDAWFKHAEGYDCPDCGGELETRTFQYPEDVFGPPSDGESPRRTRDRRLAERGREAGSRGAGVLYLFLGHVALVVLSPLVGPAVLFVGVVQMLYAVPMMIIFAVRGQGATVSGIALMAGVTFLLNATCFGLVCGGL